MEEEEDDDMEMIVIRLDHTVTLQLLRYLTTDTQYLRKGDRP